jgi:hypothetical protein
MADDGRSFRDVAAGLHRATLHGHNFDLAASRFELNTTAPGESDGPSMKLVFDDVTNLRWIRNPENDPDGSPTILAIVGLERLAPGEPWRLYLRPSSGGELELACVRVTCDGIQVTGIGRAYRS